jgi:hypothetical protein
LWSSHCMSTALMTSAVILGRQIAFVWRDILLQATDLNIDCYIFLSCFSGCLRNDWWLGLEQFRWLVPFVQLRYRMKLQWDCPNCIIDDDRNIEFKRDLWKQAGMNWNVFYQPYLL